MKIGPIIDTYPETRDFTIRRFPVGSFVDGVYVPTTSPTTIAARGAIVAISGEKRVARLPEAYRSEESIQIHTTTLLRTTRDEGRQQADEIVDVDGRAWLVVGVEDYMQIGGFCCAYAVALPVPAASSFVYYGVGSVFDLDAFTRVSATAHLTSFDVTAGPGEYIYYVYPPEFGLVDFEVSGFVGGTVDSTEDALEVARSINDNLGSTTVRLVPRA